MDTEDEEAKNVQKITEPLSLFFSTLPSAFAQ